MPIVADAAVAVRGDLTRYNADMRKAEGTATRLGGKLDTALSPKGILLGVAGGFAASQVASFLGSAITAASDFGETVSKSSQIFGDEAMPALEAWADTAADTFGQSKQQALDGAATFAIFGKSAGLAGDELVGFSTDLTELASDMASFFNTSPEEAIEAIGAALRGESEPIRKYGVLLNEATLRQRALSMGIIETTTQALTPQQRVLAAQAEIMAQTADAQGDFERTSGGLANQQRELQAKLADVTVEIGEKLLPVMVSFVTFLNDEAIPVLTDLLDILAGEKEFNLAQTIEDEFPVGEASPLGKFAAFFNQTWDTVLGRENEIRAAAEQMGVSYDEMHTAVIEAMNELDVGHGEAIDAVLSDWHRWRERSTFEISAAVAEQGTAWDTYQSQITAAAGGAVEGVAAESLGMEDALAEPVEAGGERAVRGVRDMYQRIAGEIAAREDALKQAGGDAVAAWFDPGVWRLQLSEVNAEIASADTKLAEDLRANAATIAQARESGNADALAEAQRHTAEIVSEHKARRLALLQEQMTLQINLATVGTDMEQATALSALAVSDFMVAGLNSEDTEIANAFAEWRTLLLTTAQGMTADTKVEAPKTPEAFEQAFRTGMPGIKLAAGALADAAVTELGSRDASGGGSSLIGTWVNGMWVEWNSRAAAEVFQITNEAGKILGMSLPTEGPLKGGIFSGGYSIMESWGQGIEAGGAEAQDTLQSQLDTVAAMIAPDAFAPEMTSSWEAALARLRELGVTVTDEIRATYDQSVERMGRGFDPTRDTLFEDASFVEKDFAGTRSPFGTLFPDYIHTLKEVIAWEQRVIRNTPNAPNVVEAIENGWLHATDDLRSQLTTIVDPITRLAPRDSLTTFVDPIKSAIADALSPQTNGALSGGAAGMVGTPLSGNTYQVSLLDKLEVRTVEDIGYGLKRLGELGKLPGSQL